MGVAGRGRLPRATSRAEGGEVGGRKEGLSGYGYGYGYGSCSLAVVLVDLVRSCRRVHGRQLEGGLEIRSSKRSWTI